MLWKCRLIISLIMPIIFLHFMLSSHEICGSVPSLDSLLFGFIFLFVHLFFYIFYFLIYFHFVFDRFSLRLDILGYIYCFRVSFIYLLSSFLLVALLTFCRRLPRCIFVSGFALYKDVYTMIIL